MGQQGAAILPTGRSVKTQSLIKAEQNEKYFHDPKIG
jgi:hypothetical protein